MRIDGDEYGTPTITAGDDRDACRVYEYAQALTHATAILELYGVARGRAAVQWGEQFTDGGAVHVRLGLEDAVENWWVAQE